VTKFALKTTNAPTILALMMSTKKFCALLPQLLVTIMKFAPLILVMLSKDVYSNGKIVQIATNAPNKTIAPHGLKS
jgi:hypothetical protein